MTIRDLGNYILQTLSTPFLDWDLSIPLIILASIGIWACGGISLIFYGMIAYFLFQIWPPVILYRLSRWLLRSNR